jgi:single-stranded-DNA-specific exonuclease
MSVSAASVEGEGADWPASAAALAAARAALTSALPGPVSVACDHDVDGLASAVLVSRTLMRLGAEVEIVPVGRGQHVHEPSYRDALAARAAKLYVVTDMGSRGERIGLPAPTLVIDHHDSDAFPPDALSVSAARRRPVAPTSYLAFELLRPLAAIEDLAWLALLGSEADLGNRAAFGDLPRWRAQHRHKHISEAIALLNAARRSATHDVATALRVLTAADSPRAIAAGFSPDLERLRAARADVTSEVQRWMHVAPKLLGDVAVIRIRSKAQIHPLIAVRWKTRLAGKIVLVANEEFLPGRVNFVVRSTRDLDLIAWLRALPIGDVGPEFARGHPAATGGSLEPADFQRLMAALGERTSKG